MHLYTTAQAPYILLNIFLMGACLHISATWTTNQKDIQLNPQNVYVILCKHLHKTMKILLFILYICVLKSLLHIVLLCIVSDSMCCVRGSIYVQLWALLVFKVNKGDCYITTNPVYNCVAATFRSLFLRDFRVS